MKNLLQKLSQLTCSLAIVIATIAVNTTCVHRYYQEKLSDQLASLNRYKDE